MKEKGFNVTRWYVSPTIKQQFPDGTSFPTAHAIHCEPHIRHSTDKTDRIALLRLEWGYVLKNYIEYIADDEYYLDFSDKSDIENKLNELIVISYAKFLKEFDDRKVNGFDFRKIPAFDKPKVDALRQKIIGHLQRKG